MAIPRNLANFAPKLDSSGNPTFTAPTVFSAGTVSLPSITFTGDTNTGIFSPTADTIAFTEGGTEAMRIDSSGNLGIGTTSPSGKLHAATTTNTSVYAAADSGYSLFRGATNSSGGVLSITGNSTGNGINYTVFNAALNGYEPANYDGSIQVFKTSNTERARIPAAGGFQCVNSISVGNATPTTSGAGITFPATQSASSNANTLDDYEEGTWTPVVAGSTTAGTVTYSDRYGYYTKIGRFVYVWMDVTVSAFSGGVGDLEIQSVPFTSANLSSLYPIFEPWNVDAAWGQTYPTPTGFMNVNTTIMRMYTADDNHANLATMKVNQTGRIAGYWLMQTD